MIGFIDDHRDRFGVEPICRVLSEHNLQVAPSGYYALKSRKPSKRSLSDAAVWERIEALQADKTKGNGVAGYRKMWHLLKRSLSSFLCKRLVLFCSIYRCWLMRSG